MKKIFLLFGLTLCIAQYNSYGQKELKGYYYHGQIQDGADVFLFADNVNVRSQPGTQSPVVANLPAGYRVTVVEKASEMYSFKGYTSHWYKVRVKNNGENQEGYIVGSLIGLASAKFGDYVFVYGIDGYSKANGISSSAKIISGANEIIDVLPLSVVGGMMGGGAEYEYEYSMSVGVIDNRGLSGVNKIIMLDYSYEACGYPNVTKYLFWTGKAIVKGVELNSVSEAGLFYVRESVVFPADTDGTPDVVKVINTSEEIINENTGEMETSVTETMYLWNGVELNEL